MTTVTDSSSHRGLAPPTPPPDGRRRPRLVTFVLASAALAMVVALTATGCGNDSGTGGTDDTGGTVVDATDDGGDPRPVRHAAGTTEVPADVDQVVALDQPAALNALSLEVEPAVVLAGFQAQPGADEILAGHDIATEPYSVAQPSLETVAAARPDLILASGHPSTIAAYEQYSAIAPTVVIPFSTDWHDQLAVAAAALHRADEADALAARIDRRIDDLRDTIARHDLDGTTISVIGSIRGDPFAFPNSGLAGRLLTQLGLARPPAQDIEVAADRGFIMFSPERLVDHDADTLITVTGAVYDTAETITGSPLYPHLDAVDRGDDFRVSGDMWLGAFPFAAAWIVDDLDHILIHEEQPDTAAALDRWDALLHTD